VREPGFMNNNNEDIIMKMITITISEQEQRLLRGKTFECVSLFL
jgi:hypothetical protein